MRLTARLDDIVLYIICVCNNYIWQKINQLLTFEREKGRAGVWQAPQAPAWAGRVRARPAAVPAANAGPARNEAGYAQKAKPR